jgi:hypothetical protein
MEEEIEEGEKGRKEERKEERKAGKKGRQEGTYIMPFSSRTVSCWCSKFSSITVMRTALNPAFRNERWSPNNPIFSLLINKSNKMHFEFLNLSF